MSLDKVIHQQFTTDDTRYHAASLAHLQRSTGPGWLYQLEGRTYYSPTCYRPNVKIPPTTDRSMTSDGGQNIARGSSYDHDRISHLRQPQWATKHWAFLAFTPILPDLAAPPLYSLLQSPGVVDDASGPRPDPHRWNQWIQLQRAIVESSNILLGHSGAPALRAALPHPCNKVERLVADNAYEGNVGRLYRDIWLARSWFEIWLGCLSYAIAVNNGLIDQNNAFPTSNIRLPVPWVELLLAPPEPQAQTQTRWQAAGLHPHSSRSQLNDGVNKLVTDPNGYVDPVFVSSLRNTCVANFDGSVERVGVFLEIPDGATDMVSIDWLVECKVPIWYPWGNREEDIVKRYPVFARYRPPPNAIWVTSPPPPSLEPVDLTDPPFFDSDLSFLTTRADITSGSNPQFVQRRELVEGDKSWNEFFTRAESTEQSLRQAETLEEKQERESRRLNPPITRPMTTFYTWDRTMRGTFRRRISTDEELEGLFEKTGHFGKNQARYNSFYNEWDLCRYWGAPDDDQLVFRATVQARMRGTAVQAELAWWRVYYGLPPDPPAPTLPWAEELTISSQEEPRAYPEPHRHPHPTEIQSQQPMDHVQSVSFASMEDGEIADPNIDLVPIEDLSWIVRRAYHFFGFTLPPDHDTKNPHEHTADPKSQTPAHAPRLLGVQKTPSTVRYWSSREGQAIIRFAKSLASKDPPEPCAWDLHQWNATPVVALPLFKSLKSFSSAVVVRVDKWDNVKGRSTPELSSQMETVYWLDIPSKDRTWLIGCTRPELALTLCRLGQDLACDPLSIAWHLAEHGVPFNTWFRRQNIQPLEGIRKSPHLIQFRLDSQYQFSKIDYDEYVRSRRRLLDGSAGRAALKAGGIVWRISKQDIGIRSVVSGETSQEALDGQRALHRDNKGNFLVDDSLNQDEIMAICGEYEIGIRQGNQRGRTSWWPPPDIWDECYGTNGWSHAAEEFFQSRLATIAKNFTPVTRSSWRDILRASSPLKKARGNLSAHSSRLCRGSSDGSLEEGGRLA